MHIYLKLSAQAGLNSTMSSLVFRQNVARSLMDDFMSTKISLHSCKNKRRLNSAVIQENPEHRMIKVDVRKRCVHCATKPIESRTNNIQYVNSVVFIYALQQAEIVSGNSHEVATGKLKKKINKYWPSTYCYI